MSDSDVPTRVIILGGLSAIGEATAREFAASGSTILLAGRNREQLEQVAADLKARGAKDVVVTPTDFNLVADPHEEIAKMATSIGGEVDAIFLFYGVLGDQARAQSDTAELRKIIDVNFTSAATWCVAAAALFERQNRGVLVAISSVAGDRGRKSNHVYGAAKAGLTVLVEGIAHRLAATRARAVAVKLGFVDTPMTAHIEKSGPLWAKPRDVARRLKHISAHPSRPVVYVPGYWRPIMFVIRNVPASIFHRTNL